MQKRYVIDGAPGSGKTTFLRGRSHAEDPATNHPHLGENGSYVIFPETIGIVFERMEREGLPPKTHMAEAIKRITEEERERFSNIPDAICFFDRGLPGYATIANRYQVPTPEGFAQQCEEQRYDFPVFVFSPVESYDISMPTRGPNSCRVYSWSERVERHQQTVSLYKGHGYNVLEVPVLDEDVNENFRKRLRIVLDNIK